jgi:DTW domain-containing protein YfiP/GNAT superfamily N-acetyltransferase
MKAWLFLGTAIANFLIVTTALSNNNNNQKTDGHAPHLQVTIASSITKGERRKEERQSKTRSLCEGCQRPPAICVCEALPLQKLATKTDVLVLQHPNEFRKKTFSTVPLMSLVLENMHFKRDYKFELEDLSLVQEYLHRGQKPLLLFPSDDAISLDDDYGCCEQEETIKEDNTAAETLNRIKEQGNLLIVLDGTWAEAKRMASASPCLFDVCEQVQFKAPASCLYDAIRKEPYGHCLSTLEACAQALILLEGAVHVADYLKGVLKLMVDIQLFMEKQRHDDPRQKGKQLYERIRRRQQVEKTLFEKSEPRTLDDGAILRPLAIEDAQYVEQNWYHQSRTSLRTIEQRLDSGLACFGIEKDGSLCAHIVRAEDGTLGMLFVEEAHRRKRYGRALVREATRVLRDLDKPCVCFIKQGDAAAEALFQSMGWTVEESAEKKGKRKLRRRKWVLVGSRHYIRERPRVNSESKHVM